MRSADRLNCAAFDFIAEKRVGRGALAGAVLLILAATLTPAGPNVDAGLLHPGQSRTRILADALANVLLFFPFGAAAALTVAGWRRPVMAAAALSLLIEISQLGIGGRYSSPLDFLFNTVGGAAGVLMVRSARVWWTAPSTRTARSLTVLSIMLAISVLIGGSTLFSVATPADPVRVEWIPVTQHGARYDGKILNVWSSAGDLQPGIHATHSVRGTLTEDTLHMRFIRSGEPNSAGPLLRIRAPGGVDYLVIGASDTRVTVMRRLVAARLHLDQPELRAGAAFGASEHGDTVHLATWRESALSCVQVDGERYCGGPTVGRTWALLLFPLPAIVADIMDPLWVAVLVAPSALWLSRRRHVFMASIAIAFGLGVVHLVAPVLRTPLHELVAVPFGLIGGWALGRIAAAGRPRL